MKRVWKILLWIILGVLLLGLFTWVTQLLWNWLVPALFSGPVISFWQALGILVLSKLLFSGFGKKCHCHDRSHGHWKHRLHEKFSGMTPEEREAFKQKMREKWCPTHKDDSGQ